MSCRSIEFQAPARLAGWDSPVLPRKHTRAVLTHEVANAFDRLRAVAAEPYSQADLQQAIDDAERDVALAMGGVPPEPRVIDVGRKEQWS
jgi:hypothetical protein